MKVRKLAPDYAFEDCPQLDAGLAPPGSRPRYSGLSIYESGGFDHGLGLPKDGTLNLLEEAVAAGVPEQLGLPVIVQPHSVGPFSFGNCVGVQSGKKAKPGAFSVTTIWNEAQQDDEIRALSQATAQEMLGMDGFIGLTLVRMGGRGITISAWERPEDAKQLLRSRAHREAMSRF